MTVLDEAKRDEAAPAEEERWWQQPFRMYQTNLREPDAAMDVEGVLDVIEDFGAGAWLLNGGGISSFYPTDLPFQTKNPFLAGRESGDFVGDALAAARRRGVRVLARMDFSKVESAIAAEHPDWCFVGPDGTKQRYHGLVSVCPSAPYYQRHAFDVLDEFVTRYPVDGFFFNWFSFNEMDYSRVYRGVCHCSSCVRAFAEWSGGQPLPDSRDSPGYDGWLAFSAHVIDELTDRFRRFIHERLPDAALILGKSADIVFHEANSALGREFWPHATGETVSLSKTRRPDVPVLVNSAVFVDMPYRFAPIQDEHFGQYYAQAVSRGAIPSTYVMGTPLSAPYANMGIARDVMHLHRRNEELYGALRPCARTLLVRGPVQSAGAPLQEFRGLYEALQRRHVPFDIASSADLPEILAGPSIERYSLVVLPDLAVPVADTTVSALDGFVRAGGRLVTTGSILFDEDRPRLESSPATRLVAGLRDSEELRNSYIAAEAPEEEDGYRRLVPVAGSFHYLELAADAEGRFHYLSQAPYGPPEKCYGTFPVEYPGIALRRFGEGTSAVIPWGIGETARAFGTGGIGDFFADLVEELLGDDRQLVARGLPPQVELVLGSSKGRLVVHLLNLSGVRHNSIGPAVRVAGAELVIPGGAASARALVADASCELSDEAGNTVIRIPDFGLFETIVVEGALR
jgi:hypothetical protein